MAGAGYKLFNTGDVLTAAQVNTYLQEQTVMVFASSTARTTALSGVLAEGMMSYLQDTNAVEVYNGSAWVGVSGAGDVTEVQAGTGISVASGTGPIPVVTNTMATAVDAKGDLIVGTGADTFARLAVGTNGYTLVADSAEATGLKWAAPAGGSFSGCSLSKSAAQSISNATWTLITWNQENYDTDSFHDNSTNNTRITIPSGKSGKYLIAANLYTPANSAGSRLLKYTKNGTDSYYGNWGPASAVHSTSIVGSQVFNLTAGDYIEVAIYQDTGTSINVNSGIESTFTATYLGA